MFEYILVFGLGLFMGMSIDDLKIENKENSQYKKQELIVKTIKEDYANGYEPDFELYKFLYKDSENK